MNRLGRYSTRALLPRNHPLSTRLPIILSTSHLGNCHLSHPATVPRAFLSDQKPLPKFAETVLRRVQDSEKKELSLAPEVLRRRIWIRNTLLAIWLLIAGGLLTTLSRKYISREKEEYPALLRTHIVSTFRNYLASVVWNLRGYGALDATYAKELYMRTFWSGPATESKATLGVLIDRVNTAATQVFTTSIRVANERREEQLLKRDYEKAVMAGNQVKSDKSRFSGPEFEERERIRNSELTTVYGVFRDAVTALEAGLGCDQWAGSVLLLQGQDMGVSTGTRGGVECNGMGTASGTGTGTSVGTNTGTVAGAGAETVGMGTGMGKNHVDSVPSRCFLLDSAREECEKDMLLLVQRNTSTTQNPENVEIGKNQSSEENFQTVVSSLLFPDFSINAVELAKILNISVNDSEKAVAEADVKRYTTELKAVENLENTIREILLSRKIIVERDIPKNSLEHTSILTISPTQSLSICTGTSSSPRPPLIPLHFHPTHIHAHDLFGSHRDYAVVPAGKTVYAELLDGWCRVLQVKATLAGKLDQAKTKSTGKESSSSK